MPSQSLGLVSSLNPERLLVLLVLPLRLRPRRDADRSGVPRMTCRQPQGLAMQKPPHPYCLLPPGASPAAGDLMTR